MIRNGIKTSNKTIPYGALIQNQEARKNFSFSCRSSKIKIGGIVYGLVKKKLTLKK